jgi:hypothetical protein
MSSTASHNTAESSGQQRQRGLSTTRTASTLIVFIALAAVFFTKEPASWIGGGVLPPDPLEAANVILRKTPVIVRLAPQFDLDGRLISQFSLLPSPFFFFLLFVVRGRDSFPINARMVISTLHGSRAWNMAIM